MSDSTYDLLMIQREELVADMVRALTPLLSSQFATRAEVEESLISSVTDTLNRRLDKIEEDGEKRHGEFVRQFETRFEQTASKEELAGVTKSGAENTERISKLESTLDTWRVTIERRIDKVEDIQKEQSKNIDAIKHHADTTAQNATVIRSTVDELIKRDEKRHQEIDRELSAVKDAQAADAKALRTAQEDVLGTRSEVNDMKTTLATETDKVRNRLGGLVDKVDSLEVSQQQQADKTDQIDHRQQAMAIQLTEYGALYRTVAFFTEEHPRVGGALLGMFFLTQILALTLMFYIARNGIITTP